VASNLPAYLAACAAFTVAGLSAINVGLSARFSHREELHQWRRDVLVPAVVDFLEASQTHRMATLDVSATDRGEAEAGSAGLDESTWQQLLRLRVQMTLVASPRINEAADLLQDEQEKLRQYAGRPSGTDDERRRLVLEHHSRCLELENEFVAAARESLGVQ